MSALADHVVRIRDQLGPCVLLAIPLGEKGPRTAGWQKLTQADMTAAYLASLNHGQNIGVLLGAAGQGLCTIDVDNDDLLEAFLKCNPAMRKSLISRGARGGNVWLRIKGDYPPAGKIRTLDGQAWGEWRADRNQTVFFGKHPNGADYVNNGKRPLEIAFEKIWWPDGLELPWRKSEPQPALPMPEILDETDLGRGKRFIERFGQDVRHIYEWGRWIVFERGRWNATSDGAVYRLCDQLCRELVNDALTKGEKERKSALGSAMHWGDRRLIDNMLHWARNDLRCIVRPEQLDADPWIIGARNAVVDLRTGDVFKHSRERLVTKFVGANFDPQATCPRWERFFVEIIPDEAASRYVWKAAGYSLSGHTTEHHFMFLHGRGANGKSTLLEILCAAFGDYAGRAGSRLLYATDHHGTPDDQIAELFGRRLIIGSETQEGARMNEGALKDITGGDTLRGCRKYEHGFQFRSTAKIWLAGNHKPSIRGTDDGIWRRVRLIPFEREFGPNERDENLRAKLLAELPGILNWLVQGCLLWQQEGLTPPESVKAAVDEYRSEEDVLAEFIDECTSRVPGSNIPHSDLFKAYRHWAAENGMLRPLSSKMLAKRLRERRWPESRTNEVYLLWDGVRLREEEGAGK